MRTSVVALALSLTVSQLAVAQSVRASAATSPRLWTTPWDGRPRDPHADPRGNVWFVGQAGNYIGRLDPKTGEFKRFEIESGTHPHNLVVDARGTVWFTGNANGTIVRMDPTTGKTTSIPVPDGVRDPHTMIFDSKGDAWFTAQQAAYVGKLTTADNKIRLWKMERGSRPYGIVMDSKDRPWFDLFGTNKIGTIDPKSGEFKAYTLPNDRARPRRIAVTKDDVVWYGDYTRGFLGRLDPKSGQVQEWQLPGGPGSLPYAVTSDDRGRIWLAETGPQPNRLVAFDPEQRKFTHTIVIPADKANTIRHMTFDKASRRIWFGGDANMIGGVNVASLELVP